MRKIFKSKKALSPVVAAIILIAVTVAVSIAVAAWMGALSVNFMQTEQLSITNAQFTTGQVALSVRNTGTADIVINYAKVNGLQCPVAMSNSTTGTALTTIPKNSDATVTVTTSWASGNSYQIVIMSAKGNSFPYNAVAP